MPCALFINNAISFKYQRPIIHFRQPFLYGHKWRGEKEQTVLQTHLRFRRRRRRMVLKKKILRFHSIGLFVAVRVSFNIVRFGHINRKRRGRSCQLGTLSPSSDHREICKKKNQLNISPLVLIIITDTDTIRKFSWMRFPVPVQITVWNSTWLWLWLPFICGVVVALA